LGYFTGRFLLEFVKEYQTLEAGSLLTMGQWLSLPCVLVSGAGLVWSLRQRLPAGWHAASG
jgi:prolipoprotein diacylglyceryltransferase